MRRRAAFIPNITSFHVFLGLQRVRIASVCIENEPGWLLGNIKTLFHSRLLFIPFQYIRAEPFCLTNNRCSHRTHTTGAGQGKCRSLLVENPGSSFYYFEFVIQDSLYCILGVTNLNELICVLAFPLPSAFVLCFSFRKQQHVVARMSEMFTGYIDADTHQNIDHAG